MCKHDERTDISPVPTVISLYLFYYCPGEENSPHFLILLAYADSGLTIAPSNAHFQSVCAAVRTVWQFYIRQVFTNLFFSLDPCYLGGRNNVITCFTVTDSWF